MFQAGTDPAVAQMDFDHDGLGIATERGDVIGAWACFHIPDIFVEVDWMPGHEMIDEAVAKVLWAFARHGIALHIDRGEMGGGSQVTHEDTIRFTHDNDDDDRNGNPDSPGLWDDFYDFKYGEDENFNGILDAGEDRNGNGRIDSYFDHARFGIFHYVLFTHETESWWNNQWHIDSAGWGEQPGNDFIVTKRVSKVENTFMHELGHNLGLSHTNGQPNEKDSVMYTPSADANRLDYFSSQWAVLDFTQVVGGD